ncbi:probable LRR receptor-like serine/threonine-protein kinase At1g51810 [Oryza sativa Japonica Group]|jgi:hypothetical protein|uniref:probable LRR receptor-like serine/threonine-protein kinase At1g51810 n=1 Tax=Oryza sativa subsp. japonica TaxID=39947 RepID=UPI00339BCE22
MLHSRNPDTTTPPARRGKKTRSLASQGCTAFFSQTQLLVTRSRNTSFESKKLPSNYQKNNGSSKRSSLKVFLYAGFLSIDCGYTDSAGYDDKNTMLPYVSDKGYIKGGKTFSILSQYMKEAANKQEETLRSFPDGQRNCYTLPTNRSKKYLIRATFTYGNYDGRNSSESGSPFLFGLHIGINFWTMVNLTKLPSSNTIWKELIMVAPGNSVSVCLINNELGTPFISTLDLRPLQDTMYPFVNVSVAVSYFSRQRYGQVNDVITR